MSYMPYDMLILNGQQESDRVKIKFDFGRPIIFNVGTKTNEYGKIITFEPKVKKGPNDVITHHVAKSRKELFDRGNKPQIGPNDSLFVWNNTFLIGDRLEIKQLGKMIATGISEKTGEKIQVATDIEIANLANDPNNIYWYIYDPDE